MSSRKPKYVAQYFPAGARVSRATIEKRFKRLDKSRFGYKTNEYKDLKRYLKTYRAKARGK